MAQFATMVLYRRSPRRHRRVIYRGRWLPNDPWADLIWNRSQPVGFWQGPVYGFMIWSDVTAPRIWAKRGIRRLYLGLGRRWLVEVEDDS